MFIRCFTVTAILVLILTMLCIHCPEPPRHSLPATPEDQLHNLNATIAGIEETQQGLPFAEWREDRRQLWGDLQQARRELLLNHPRLQE